jgi:ferredoxin
MKILSKSRLEEALSILAEDAALYVPSLKGEVTGFFPWKKGEARELVLDQLNTGLSPKSVVLPQTEKMHAFKTEKQEVEITEILPPEQNRIIFGIRACDLKAIMALDQVFLTGYIDRFYEVRRSSLTIIAQACYQPGANCFCESMGVIPTEPQSADVVLHDLGDEFGWEIKSEQGKIVTAKLTRILLDREYSKPEAKNFKKQVNREGLVEHLKEHFEHPVWEELASQCMNCGICTYICPSCYCFDIQAKNRGSEGYYFRCWDSCMYKEYNQMAGGHNPRVEKKARFRNRFMHKLAIFEERYGTPLCTGCGRCIAMCPNGVDIIKVIESLKGVDKDDDQLLQQ